MTPTPEKISGARGTAEKTAEAARKKLEEAKDGVSIGKLFKELLDSFKEKDHKETFKKLSAIILAVFSGKLAGLKADVEKTRQEKGEGTEENDKKNEVKTAEANTPEPAPSPEKKESDKPESGSTISKIDKTKFRQGELFASLAEFCPYAKIESGLVSQETKIVTIQGIPGWERGAKTDNWDYEKAGNTEDTIAEGVYKVDTVKRAGSQNEKVPQNTQKKLEQIAIALQHDPRMPLFTGIDMTVDGITVTMVKEIHCWNRSQTKSKTLGQPHTGTAYIIKT